MAKTRNRIAGYFFNPANYIVLGIVAAVLFGAFNASLLWIALAVTILALPVHYGRRWYDGFCRARWESLWLEEDFVA